MSRRVYYRDDDVVGTQTQFRVRDGDGEEIVYALAGITSIRVYKVRPDTTNALTVLVLGLLLSVFLIGIPIAIIGFIIWLTTKPYYCLLVRDSSGESRVLEGADKEDLEEIAEAIESAIDARG